MAAVRIGRPSHATVVAYTALVMAMGGSAVAATGGTFILGHANKAGATTSLTRTTSGAPLALNAKSGSPALAVNSTKQIAKLNASLVGGRSATQLRPSVLVKQNKLAGEYASTVGTPWPAVTGMSGTLKVPAGVSQRTLFLFSSDCVVSGSVSDWASIRIRVDGVDVTPANDATGTFDTGDDDFAFCSPVVNGSNVGDGRWQSASVQGFKTLSPGQHTVTVQVHTTDNHTATIGNDDAIATTARIDNMQLTAIGLP